MTLNDLDRERLDNERTRRSSWGTVRSERLQALMSSGAASVLDVGCGSGGYVSVCRSRGLRAVGVDLLDYDEWRPAALTNAVADAAALPFANDTFDTVFGFETLEHVRDPSVALSEWTRVARRHVVLSVPNAAEPSWAPASGLVCYHHVDQTHRTLFDEDSLRAHLEDAGLSVVTLKGILPVHPWVAALGTAGVPLRIAGGVGRHITRMGRRPHYSSLLAVASVS